MWCDWNATQGVVAGAAEPIGALCCSGSEASCVGDSRDVEGETGMTGRRPKGVIELGWACLDSAARGRTEHRPVSSDYSDDVVRRFSFEAGGGLGWRVSALQTPRPQPAPWKIVVITGAPSWAEYWAPVMAALPLDREMIVVDRPGFAASQPGSCVPDIRVQARALAPLLTKAKGQKLLLVGQSYGAAIATLMAEANPRAVDQLSLLSSYLGVSGPTASWLVRVGSSLLNVIPRDLKHAVMEIQGQAPQLGLMEAALPRLEVPVHMFHGDQDDFAPLEIAHGFSRRGDTRHPMRFERVSGANHFFNDGPTETLLAALESCIPRAAPRRRWILPKLRELWTPLAFQPA